jgi:ligand-binding sensor domain-containing protein
MNKPYFFIVTIFIFFSTAPAISQQIRFNRITTNLENDPTSILGIAEDHEGNIWLATMRGGLCKYDGSEFKSFIHDPRDSNSIINDLVECIFIDLSDVIWIGTWVGLDRFDPATNTFTLFRHDSTNSSSLAGDYIGAILEDHLGNLWIGTNGGLDLFDRKAGRFIHYPHKTNDSSSLSSNSIRAIYEDHKGTLWVACGNEWDTTSTTEGGLNRLNRATGTFTRYLHDPSKPNSLATNRVKAMFEDSRGNFWVGTTGNGLHIMDRNKGTFTHFFYDPKHPEKLSRPPLTDNPVDQITFINEDAYGGIWIGSLHGGINRYDTNTRRITHFGTCSEWNGSLMPKKQDTTAGFGESNIWQALFSRDGVIWIGTFWPTAGALLYQTNLFGNTIPFYKTNKPFVASIYYDGDSILWLGTWEGLIKKNVKSQTERLFVNNPKNSNSLSQNSVSDICADMKGNLWIGTWGGGLNRFNPHTALFTRFGSDPKNGSSLCNNFIHALFIDHNNDLWIGTNEYGLDKMDHQSGRFKHYKIEGSGYDPGKYVTYIREDRDHDIWVGTKGGLFRVHTDNGIIEDLLPNAGVNSICIDSKNNVWIGADTMRTQSFSSPNILYRFERSHHEFIAYIDAKSKKPISSEFIFNLMEDDQKNLWLGTRDAIIKINAGRDTVREYGESFGVHRNWWFDRADNFKAKSGELFFCDHLGYYAFSPDEVKNGPNPQLNFTVFKVNDREVLPGRGGILEAPIWKTREIALTYKQNSFSFDFSAIHYSTPGKENYLFTLENYDRTWHAIGENHLAYYSNVPPGQYVLHIKAVNSDGAWSEKSIRIFVSRPWWQTWWFYLILISAFVLLMYSLYRYRLNDVLRLQAVRNKISRDLHDDLGATLSSISVLSEVAKENLEKGKPDESYPQLTKINNYSREMVDKMRDIVWAINPTNDNLGSLIQRLKNYCAEVCTPHEISAQFIVEEAFMNLAVPMNARKNIYLICKEAIHNSVAHSRCKNIHVRLNTFSSEIHVEISDDGCGLKQHELTSGNGLINMQSRAMEMNGKLTVRSSQAGTSVLLNLVVPQIRS